MSVEGDLANTLIDTFARDGTYWRYQKLAWDFMDAAGVHGAGEMSDFIDNINNSLPKPDHIPDDDPDIPPPPPTPAPPPNPDPQNPPTPPDSNPGGVPSNPPTPPRDPLVIDLNGDGAKFLTFAQSSAKFDIDSDGFRESVSWVDPNDGFLALDQNGNGKIDSLAELFGSEQEDGFSALSHYDGNQDGLIDRKDAIFSSLEIWRDSNGNGQTDADELFSLKNAGIKSISLNSIEVHDVRGDATVTHTSTVNFNNGRTSEAVAALLGVNQLLTDYVIPDDFSLVPEAGLLPFMKGYGNIPDLFVAATLNAALLEHAKDLVQNFWSYSAETATDKFDQLLYEWAGVSNVDPEARGGTVDARQMEFLEALYGQTLAGDLISERDAATFSQSFDHVRDAWLVRFLAQRGGSAIALSDDPAQEYYNIQTQDLVFASVAINPITSEYAFDPYLFVFRMQGLLLENVAAGLSDAYDVVGLAKGLSADLTNGDPVAYQSQMVAAATQLLDHTAGRIFSELFKGATVVIGTDSGDSLAGSSGVQIMYGGASADSLTGGTGSDVYLFNPGDGQDRIDDSGWTGESDTVVFGAGISASRVKVTQTDNGNDLVLSVTGSADQVTLDQSVADEWHRVENVAFADGTLWDWNALLTKATTATAGADTFYGDERANLLTGLGGTDYLDGRGGNDTLSGGVGKDVLIGGVGSDTYLFNVGDGQDRVDDSGWTGELDTVVFGNGISSGQVKVTQADNGNDIILSVSGSDQLTLDQSVMDEWHRVENVRFADGTVWDWSTVLAKATTATNGADTFYGDELANSLNGLGGADYLDGRGGNDTLSGGVGKDVLIGGVGSDTYLFNVGDGQDRIDDGGWTGEADSLVFGNGISASQVKVTQADNGNDLVLSVTGSTDQVTLDQSVIDEWHRVENVRFADGTVWDWSAVLAKGTTATSGADTFYGDERANAMAGLAGADYLDGRGGNDMLSGGTGRDVLIGGVGSDTYLFNLGDGQDRIDDSGWTGEIDTLSFGSGILPSKVQVTQADGGNDVVLLITGTTDQILLDQSMIDEWHRVEVVRFADGTEWDWNTILTKSTAGTSGSDTLYGDERANTLTGVGGADSLYGRGSNDTLAGGVGRDLLVGGTGSDVYLFNPGDGQDRIDDSGWTGESDTVVFGAGISASQVKVTQTDNGNDLVLSVTGSADQVTLDQSVADEWHRVENVAFADGTLWDWNALLTKATTATAGADTFYGDERANLLTGLGGTDYLDGRGGNDTLSGGVGKDVLIGGVGSDTYLFNVGDGQDRVDDSGWTGELDTVVFGNGISSGQVKVTQADNGNDIILSVSGSDQLTLDQSVMDEWHRVENVRFADGTVWDWSTVLAKATTATNGADTFYGDELANSLNGLGGADYLDGRGGNDTLSGGVGKDVLIGGVGSDTYLFNVGDGQDRIDDGGWTGEADSLVFGNGISASQVKVTQADNGNDLVLSVTGSTDQVTLDQSVIDEWHRVENVRFADGTVWDWSAVLAKGTTATSGADTFYGDERANAMAGLAGADYLDGRGGNDMLSGGTGRDVLIGGVGSDTYLFNLGDGQDRIDDSGWTGEVDTLSFGSGILPSQVQVSQTDNGSDVLLTIAGTSDQVTLDQSIFDEWRRVENVSFADGTFWDWDDIVGKLAPAGGSLHKDTALLSGSTFSAFDHAWMLL